MAYLNYDLSFVLCTFYGENVVKSIIISGYNVGFLTELKFNTYFIYNCQTFLCASDDVFFLRLNSLILFSQ